jgi:hypothetical protein
MSLRLYTVLNADLTSSQSRTDLMSMPSTEYWTDNL